METIMSSNQTDPKKICCAFQSAERHVRKGALIELQEYLSDSRDEWSQKHLQIFFQETHIYILGAFRDKAEAVRYQAIKFLSFLLLDKLDKNDYYLAYVFPVLVERIGTPEIIEESEEIRLELVCFLTAIIVKYSNTKQLKPFIYDCVAILSETVKDKHPKVKEASCDCIVSLAKALPGDFHTQSESLVKPVLGIFGYQRFKVRVKAVNCIGDIVMHSSYKVLEEVVGPMAERLFDQIPAVRQAVAKVAGRWLLEYRDRYSYFHKLLPLILTGLNDEIPETREVSNQLWAVIGSQYLKENENDLKDHIDYLHELPKHYPSNLTRPHLGCRVLVERNVSKIVPALARELNSWQTDIKIRCSQLLCAVVLHAEEGITQHVQDLLSAMYLAARDEDKRVTAHIVSASELLGLFVSPATWTKLILPALEDGPQHYGVLRILAGLIRGTPKENVLLFLEQISKVLAEDSVCQKRKALYQLELVNCVKAILSKTGPSEIIGECLFVIILTTISLRDEKNFESINFELLDQLSCRLMCESSQQVWSKYSRNLLKKINKDPKAWTAITVECCIFQNFTLKSGETFGENLDIVGEILKEALHPEANPESRLRIFSALSVALDDKDTIFTKAPHLEEFLRKLLEQVLVPSLVWHAGRTAEAMRTIAASCLYSVLNPGHTITVFPNAPVFRSYFDQLLPLLLSLTEDSAARNRQLAIKDLVLLKDTAVRIGNWSSEDFLRIYPELLKRLDDPVDTVRLSAADALPSILQNPPEAMLTKNYKGHHEFIIDTLLTHFDDDDKNLQKIIRECLSLTVQLAGKKTLIGKLNKHKSLLKNRDECIQILDAINVLEI